MLAAGGISSAGILRTQAVGAVGVCRDLPMGHSLFRWVVPGKSAGTCGSHIVPDSHFPGLASLNSRSMAWLSFFTLSEDDSPSSSPSCPSLPAAESYDYGSRARVNIGRPLCTALGYDTYIEDLHSRVRR